MLLRGRIGDRMEIKMSKKSQTKNYSYGIVGLGRFGMALALELAKSGAELIVIDKSEEKIRELREYTDNAFVVQSLDRKTLSETGIQYCDVAIVCISSAMDTSILTTLHLVSMGIPSVMAKSNSKEHGEILEKIGAKVVYPEQDMAIRLAHRLSTSLMLDYVQLSEKLNISKLRLPGKAVGKTVLEVNLRKHFGVNIIAIENDGKLNETVSPEYTFRDGDILFLSGSREGLNRLSKWDD